MKEALWVLLLALSILRLTSVIEVWRPSGGEGDTSRQEGPVAATRAAAPAEAHQGHDGHASGTGGGGIEEDGRIVTLRGGDQPMLAPYATWVGGHYLFIHQRDHGAANVLHRVAEYQQTTRRRAASRANATLTGTGDGKEEEEEDAASGGMPIDAVILDAFWWAPGDVFAFHPQLYPDPAALIATLHQQNIKIVLWMSALVPAADRGRMHTLRSNGYGIYVGGTPFTPHMFQYRHHPYTNPLRGALLDFSNPRATSWFYAQLRDFLQRFAIDAVRLGGVDTLLMRHTHPKGASGHITPSEYSAQYYRWFHDAGRQAVGFHFAVVSRPVDTYEEFVYHRFGPPDVTFAGWVGDHRFTFNGLRDTAMNLLHGAQACYTSLGCFVGGTLLDDVGTLPDDTLALLDQGARAFEQGVGGTAGIETMRRRAYHVAEAALPSQVVETFPRLAAAANATAEAYRLAVTRRRHRELLLRWADLSAFLPFFATGAGHLHHPWTFHAAHAYRRLVRLHRSLVLFHAANAAAALLSSTASAMMLTPGRHHNHAEMRAMRQGCPIHALSTAPVHFDFPVLGDWGLLLGSAIAVFPVLDSFGAYGGGGDSFGAFLASAKAALRAWWKEDVAHRAAAASEQPPRQKQGNHPGPLDAGCPEFVHWRYPHVLAIALCGQDETQRPQPKSAKTAANNDDRSFQGPSQQEQLFAMPGTPVAFQRTDTLVPLFFDGLRGDASGNEEASGRGEGMAVILRSVSLMASAPHTNTVSLSYATPAFASSPHVPSVRAVVNTSTRARVSTRLDLPSLQALHQGYYGSVNGSATRGLSGDAKQQKQQAGALHFGEDGGDIDAHRTDFLVGLQMFLPAPGASSPSTLCKCTTGNDISGTKQQEACAALTPLRLKHVTKKKVSPAAAGSGGGEAEDDADDLSASLQQLAQRALRASGTNFTSHPPPLCYLATQPLAPLTPQRGQPAEAQSSADTGSEIPTASYALLLLHASQLRPDADGTPFAKCDCWFAGEKV